MDQLANIVERIPSVAEYCDLVESVGFRHRDPRAVEIALQGSYFAVCADDHIRLFGSQINCFRTGCRGIVSPHID